MTWNPLLLWIRWSGGLSKMVTFWAESWNQKQHEDLGDERPKDGGSSKAWAGRCVPELQKPRLELDGGVRWCRPGGVGRLAAAGELTLVSFVGSRRVILHGSSGVWFPCFRVSWWWCWGEEWWRLLVPRLSGDTMGARTVVKQKGKSVGLPED